MTEDRPAFLVFAKYPIPGRVKTRLAKSIGAEAAAQLYRGMAELCIQNYTQCNADCTVYYDPPEEQVRFREWLGDSVTYRAQPPGNLGDRLIAGTSSLLQCHSGVIALGTDSPTIPEAYLHEAIEALEKNDVVIGPTEDGGYYLIGLSVDVPQLFTGIDWSTERVLDQTLRNCAEANLSVHKLPSWYDIDEAKDLDRLREIDDPKLQQMLKPIAP